MYPYKIFIKQLVTKYVNDKGWNLKEIYVDDGYSGTNFDRPDFKRMINDAENGKINCIVTKDMSRFGRDYIKTGQYVEEFFNENNIRLIAVTDDFDSMKDDNGYFAFKNIMNEWYPKDVSKKVRQVKKSRAQQGKFMGSHAPYGYIKSPADKHLLIIDESAAKVVRRIFDEFRSGASARGISEKLNIEKIDSPRFFCFSNGSGQKPKANEHNSWSSSTILSMIRNQVYIGNMVQGKREVVSFKKKTRRAVDPSQWIIVENTHEPIIDRSTWDDVQSRIVNGKHHVRRTKSADKIGLFSGCAICGDCGLKLAYYKRNSYRCSLFNNAGKEACSPHSIRESTLSEFVLNDIRHYAVLAKAVRDKIRQRLIRDMSKSRINETKLLERKISELEAKQREN